MKCSSFFQRVIQLVIVFCCLLTLALHFSMGSKAQTCIPPLVIYSPDSSGTEVRWLQGKNIAIKIWDRADDQTTSDEEFNAIDSAIQDWNSVKITGCSNVTFGNAVRGGRAYRATDQIPDDTVFVYWVTDRSGQFYGIFQGTHMRAGTVLLNAGYSLDTRDPHFRTYNLPKHEIGHSFGVDNGHSTDPPSVMAQNSFDALEHYVITACDIDAHKRAYCPATPTPTPTPVQPTCGSLAVPVELDGSCPVGYLPDGRSEGWCCPYLAGGCNQPANPDGSCSTGFVNVGGTCTRSSSFQNQCYRFGDYDSDSCACTGGCGDGGGCSPIVVDVLGNGFSLTSADNGVSFDLRNSGNAQVFSWTAPDSDDAWLAFDRNGNGIIDSGKELFGNVTPQLPPDTGESMNGFRALAMYDGFGYGGNGDGQITDQDAIFGHLKLWQDRNHNGISESCEMFTLPQIGIAKIDLNYRLSGRTDQYGNQFRYRSKVVGTNGSQLGRWAWDVYLVVQQ